MKKEKMKPAEIIAHTIVKIAKSKTPIYYDDLRTDDADVLLSALDEAPMSSITKAFFKTKLLNFQLRADFLAIIIIKEIEWFTDNKIAETGN